MSSNSFTYTIVGVTKLRLFELFEKLYICSLFFISIAKYGNIVKWYWALCRCGLKAEFEVRGGRLRMFFAEVESKNPVCWRRRGSIFFWCSSQSSKSLLFPNFLGKFCQVTSNIRIADTALL